MFGYHFWRINFITSHIIDIASSKLYNNISKKEKIHNVSQHVKQIFRLFRLAKSEHDRQVYNV
jgi:hypothetical protein